MKKILIYIAYNGRWTSNNKYVDHQVKITMVQEGIGFLELQETIYKELALDSSESSLNILFDTKMDTSRGMTIENDNNVAIYMYMIQNEEEFKRCPLIVEIEPKVKSKEARLPESSIVKENSVRYGKGKEAIMASEDSSKMRGKSTSWSSNNVEVQNVEVLSPMTILPTMEIENIKVNNVFKNKQTLKSSLAMIAIKKNFQYKIDKSCSEVFWTSCIDSNCKWFLHARNVKNTEMFKVVKYNEMHTCSLDYKSGEHRQASAVLIGNCIKEKLRDPKAVYRPRELMNEMRDKYGLTISYEKAWRAREAALVLVRGSNKENYGILPSYLHMLKSTNPGTITRIEKDEENRYIDYII